MNELLEDLRPLLEEFKQLVEKHGEEKAKIEVRYVVKYRHVAIDDFLKTDKFYHDKQEAIMRARKENLKRDGRYAHWVEEVNNE